MTIILPDLRVGKLRLRGVKPLVQGEKAGPSRVEI